MAKRRIKPWVRVTSNGHIRSRHEALWELRERSGSAVVRSPPIVNSLENTAAHEWGIIILHSPHLVAQRLGPSCASHRRGNIRCVPLVWTQGARGGGCDERKATAAYAALVQSTCFPLRLKNDASEKRIRGGRASIVTLKLYVRSRDPDTYHWDLAGRCSDSDHQPPPQPAPPRAVLWKT